MAEESPAPQRDLLSSLLPTPPTRHRRSVLAADSDDSDDDGGGGGGGFRSRTPLGGGGVGGSLGGTPSDRFRSAAAMSSGQRRAFTGRTRELLLAKNAREASREKATLKQHCNSLEDKIRSLESTTAASASASCEKMEQLETEVVRLKAELTEAKRRGRFHSHLTVEPQTPPSVSSHTTHSYEYDHSVHACAASFSVGANT